MMTTCAVMETTPPRHSELFWGLDATSSSNNPSPAARPCGSSVDPLIVAILTPASEVIHLDDGLSHGGSGGYEI